MTHFTRAEDIIPQLSALLSAHSFPNWFYFALMAGAFLALALVALAATRGARRQRRNYADLNALHAALLQRYHTLLAESGGALRLIDPDACEQAATLREYAEQLRDNSGSTDPHDTPHIIARGLEDIADELDPLDDDDGDDSNDETSAVGSGASVHGIH